MPESQQVKVGDRIPAAELHYMSDDGPATITTAEIFEGKKVVLFAVPGAFTPTCSMAHLPGYVVHADEILAKGVDSIVCMAVNDVFVMDAWGKNQNAEKLLSFVGKDATEAFEATGHSDAAKGMTKQFLIGDYREKVFSA